MAVESVDDIAMGDTVRFKTVSPHDNVYWQGKVIAVCSYDIARQYNGNNVDTYYQDVKRVMTNLKAKENLTYVLLKVSTSENSSGVAVFAKEWIDASTLEHINDISYRDIRIYGIDSSKLDDIIQYIATAYPGYTIEAL